MSPAQMKPCPICGHDCHLWDFFCFGCFLVLPADLKFKLASMTPLRASAFADARDWLRTRRKAEEERKGPSLFPAGVPR